MLATSDRYAQAITHSHTRMARVEVLEAGQVIASTDVGAPEQFAVQATGGVTCDSSASVRRRSEVTLLDPDSVFIPAAADDLFSPLSSHEVKVSIGVDYEDGAEPELLPQGVFGILDSDGTDTTSARSVKLTLLDRADELSRAKWTAPYYVQENQNYIDAIKALILDRVPSTTFRTDPTIHLTPFQTYNEQADPLQAAQDMALSIGMELFYDTLGVCVIRTVPDPASAPVAWHYQEGEAALLAVENQSSRERVFSGQIVVGDSSSGYAPARAEVWDTDPFSPTFVDRFGRVPNFTTDPLVLTDAQALDKATALFRQQKGFARILRFEVIPNPAHDFLDVVWITREASRIDDAFMLDTWTVPYAVSENMPITTRERRT